MADPWREIQVAKAEKLDKTRSCVDLVDEKIVREWIYRGALVMQAGRLKPTGVTSPKRQQEVIENVRRIALDAAGNQGATLDGMPELVVEMYKLLIPKIVELQQNQLARERGEALPQHPSVE